MSIDIKHYISSIVCVCKTGIRPPETKIPPIIHDSQHLYSEDKLFTFLKQKLINGFQISRGFIFPRNFISSKNLHISTFSKIVHILRVFLSFDSACFVWHWLQEDEFVHDEDIVTTIFFYNFISTFIFQNFTSAVFIAANSPETCLYKLSQKKLQSAKPSIRRFNFYVGSLFYHLILRIHYWLNNRYDQG